MNNPDYQRVNSIHEISVKDFNGDSVKLSKYKGHVCIIVNVACNCGLAEINFLQLNELYQKYAKDKGLRILAFPCVQFRKHDQGTSEDIMSFTQKHDVKFDIFEKVDVNCDNASTLWKYLKLKQPAGKTSVIKWNFTKFIINQKGIPVQRYEPKVMPIDLVSSLEELWL